MSLSYKKLWKQLIDRDMTRTELVGEMMEVVLDDPRQECKKEH